MRDKRYEYWKSHTERERIGRLLWHLTQDRRASNLKPAIPPFAEIVLADNLARVPAALTATGKDKAAGPDEAKFSDLSVSERWDICRALSRELLAGQYEPSARRIVKLQKRDGGTRPISIRSIVHRIVTTAVYWALYPAIDPTFVRHSYGFRPRRSAWDMLLAVRRDVQTIGVIVINDITKAFDFVNINLAMEDINRHVTSTDLRNLIARILRGHPRDIRDQAGVGTDQGSALSPLILNILLHHQLDVPLAGTSDPVVHRYADNLCTVATTALQGQNRMRQTGELLAKIGMQLKHPIEAVDLQAAGGDQPPELLGYQLRLGPTGTLTFGLAETAVESLRESLQEAYEAENPSQYARSAVLGWCNTCGPTLEIQRYDDVTDRILSEAAGMGFREIPGEACRRALQASLGRWQAVSANQRAA